MPRTTTKTTTQRGLGWKHQQEAARLLRRHTDGTRCWWCGLPMFREITRNWDDKRLAADHSQARAFGGIRADRLLHGNCNSQRGDGTRDHQRPAVIDCHPSEWTATLTARGINLTPIDNTDGLAMDW